MRILLVQTSFLGDIILSTPVIAGIKEIFPQAELWMLTTPAGAELVRRDPMLKGVLPFDKRGKESGLRGLLVKAAELRSMSFDRVYCLHRSWRSTLLLWASRIPFRTGFKEARLAFLYHYRQARRRQQHEVLRNLSILAGQPGTSRTDFALRVFAPQAAELPALVRSFTQSGGPYVVLAPGSHWETKRWQADGFKSAGMALSQGGLRVILIGRSEESGLGEAVAGGTDMVNLIGRTSLAETAALIKGAALLICNDSMVLHLASAFKVPAVAVFCSTSPDFGFGPWQNKARVLEKTDLACRPCGRHGHHRCPTGTQACMREVAAEEVLQAARELLQEKGIHLGLGNAGAMGRI